MNFTRDVVDAADPAGRAIVECRRDGSRREWTFGEVSGASWAFAGHLLRRGVGRGDVVMTLVGNRPEWVLAMLACFRIGAVALPMNEQLRAADLRARIDVARPAAIVCDERNLGELRVAVVAVGTAAGEAVGGGSGGAVDSEGRPGSGAGGAAQVIVVPDAALFSGAQSSPADNAGSSGTPGRVGSVERASSVEGALDVDLGPDDPALITFTSGTTGTAKGIVHGQRYLFGQALQAEHWLGAEPGELVWCTAASGWSKSARNVFIAPWLRGAAALLHDARFDPQERLDVLEREGVNVLCMAPTEYRVIAKRTMLRRFPALRGLVAAGEALNPEVLHAWESATGIAIRDGYGQTETGQLTGTPPGTEVRPGSMGRPLPGIDLAVEDGELVLRDPRTDPTFFVGVLGGGAAPSGEPWRTGDRVRVDADGYLFFEGRSDDVIISAGYRIGPFEVESALVSHPAVAEAAAVAAPDEERGAVVRAVVVLRDGVAGSPELVRELQDYVKSQTAPYKYPRVVDFVDELPKTASGKVQRALLREG